MTEKNDAGATIIEQSERTAFEAGKNAVREGHTDCPYPPGTVLYHHWVDGYTSEVEFQTNG